MSGYYFKLVCVDDNNPIEYCVLEDVNIENLEEVHKYVIDHIKKHTPEHSKWMLIPIKKQQTNAA